MGHPPPCNPAITRGQLSCRAMAGEQPPLTLGAWPVGMAGHDVLSVGTGSCLFQMDKDLSSTCAGTGRMEHDWGTVSSSCAI